MAKDYYKVLGITEEEKKLPWDDYIKVVKNRYKALAKQWHPDRQIGKSDEEKKKAEETFKDVAEAYEVLSDKDKKAKYDTPMGGNPFEGFSGGNPFGGNPFGDFDPFSFFGGGRRREKKQTRPQGESFRIEIGATLEELYNGTKKTINYKRNEPCHSCHGSGLGPNGKMETCPHCGGTGMYFQQRGSMQTMTTCPYCHGSGQLNSNPCPTCHGKGVEPKDHQVTFDIPKGFTEGIEIRLSGEGGLPSDANGIPGDLFVYVSELKHPTFVRRGNDLLFEMEVPIITALLGGEVTVTTIDGKKLTTKIQQGTVDGTNIKFAGKGMPIYGKNNRFGNMIGIVKLVMPNKLNDEEKRLLTELKEQEHFKVG